jgi:hypothetical protein
MPRSRAQTEWRKRKRDILRHAVVTEKFTRANCHRLRTWQGRHWESVA